VIYGSNLPSLDYIFRVKSYLLVQELLELFKGDKAISVDIKGVKFFLKFGSYCVKFSLALDLGFGSVDVGEALFEHLVGVAHGVH
jgi:hypothetical protein